MLSHIAEWASARKVVVREQPPAEAPRAELVAAGVPPAGPPAEGTAEGVAASATDAAPPTTGAEAELRTERFAQIGVSLTVLAFLVHLMGVAARGFAAGPRVPWGNMFEFATTGALAAVAAYLVALKLYRTQWLGLLVTGFAVVVLGVAMLTPVYVAPGPLVPALHSYWLAIHVSAAAISGGAFGVGALASVLYLLKSRAESRTPEVQGVWSRLPAAIEIDRIAYKVHAFAFPLWTFGALIAGPIWAYYAWSRFWGWDPKEVWALITWVVYAAYLHARATAGWQGRRASIIALVGFATFLFSFIGINLFGSGLHAYAGV
ncbi:MAG: c-type cytochrome biogenesis protein CcsB [Propionibacteriales bacterium]|nr:c-type cytochrome biogenesis protein CcsB [Propionibacteriales bacterium]